ncbi:hypothetical protein PBRA_009630 [Plasmodiophora brassicae]|uniref:Uncharacterized protein n=1 Tax=Plasmodiophora brassicae TaxID=37360 RepID=A0A0G4IIU3_PLABS|nr:hypothetical protein PBRA_009630 [Plasmodiophora brassicae]
MPNRRSTYLEGLDEPSRNELLDMAIRLQQSPSRVSVDLSQSSDDGSSNAHGDIRSGSLYMKNIWQLRHRVNALAMELSTVKELLAEADQAKSKLTEELQDERRQHQAQVCRLAAQIEELISAVDTAKAQARSADDASSRYETDLHDVTESNRNLRGLLATELRNWDRPGPPPPTAWQRLATPEVVAASEPPPRFPVPLPVPFTAAQFRSMQLSVKQLTGERDQLRDRVLDLQNRLEDAQKAASEQTKQFDEERAKTNTHLTGAVRRIQYLLTEQEKSQADARSTAEYVARLEKSLLRQHDELQKKPTPSIRPSQEDECSSADRRVDVSPEPAQSVSDPVEVSRQTVADASTYASRSPSATQSERRYDDRQDMFGVRRQVPLWPDKSLSELVRDALDKEDAD